MDILKEIMSLWPLGLAGLVVWLTIENKRLRKIIDIESIQLKVHYKQQVLNAIEEYPYWDGVDRFKKSIMQAIEKKSFYTKEEMEKLLFLLAEEVFPGHPEVKRDLTTSWLAKKKANGGRLLP